MRNEAKNVANKFATTINVTNRQKIDKNGLNTEGVYVLTLYYNLKIIENPNSANEPSNEKQGIYTSLLQYHQRCDKNTRNVAPFYGRPNPN